jgi:hypothetical protein
MSFNGTASYSILDTDLNGYAEALAADIEYTVTEPGEYLVTGTLWKDDSMISIQPRFFSVTSSKSDYSGPPATVTAHLEFSGEQVFLSGENGPYEIRIYGISLNGTEDSLILSTPLYLYTEFGELGAVIASFSDQGIDTDTDGQFNLLRTQVNLGVRAPATYRLIASLVKDSTTITSAFWQAPLDEGTQQVTLDFAGKIIRNKGLDGPYQITLTLQDSSGSTIGGTAHTTLPYQAASFDLALAPTGTHDDLGMDLNSNGLYDILRVRFTMNVDSAGIYTFIGWLGEGGMRSPGSSESVFGSADTTVSLSPGSHTVCLDFSGTVISSHAANGPYIMPLLDVQGEDISAIGQFVVDFATEAYAYMDFEGSPSTVEYTNVYDDYAEDTNGNSRYDQLVVRMQAVFAPGGVILGFAELRDSDGRTIAQGSGYADAEAGVPTMIPIIFDGRYVFGDLRNGPYHILNAFLYPSGDINLGVTIADVGMTNMYQYDLFEPAAVITGHVNSLASGEPAIGASLSSSEAIDFVDTNGYYRLVYLTEGNKHFELSVPDFPTAEWSVYHNGAFIGQQSSADVVVQIGRIDTVDFMTDHPLPVELLFLEAIAGDRSVSLNWTTASETGNDHFDIQRDGALVGRVTARNSASGSAYNWSEANLTNGREYTYSLIAVDVSGLSESIGTVNATPTASAASITEYALRQNYPNPFNPETNIIFDIVEEGNVSLTVYNPLGQTIATLMNGIVQSGRHTVSFNGGNLPSGLYFYRLDVADFSAIKKMILMK